MYILYNKINLMVIIFIILVEYWKFKENVKIIYFGILY